VHDFEIRQEPKPNHCLERKTAPRFPRYSLIKDRFWAASWARTSKKKIRSRSL
jgi:hypothetical protein